jgi:hypothetical protein
VGCIIYIIHWSIGQSKRVRGEMDERKRTLSEKGDEEEDKELLSLLRDDNNGDRDAVQEESTPQRQLQKKFNPISHDTACKASQRIVRLTTLGKIREWQFVGASSEGHASHLIPIENVGWDVLRSILRIAINRDFSDLTLQTCKSIALVCKAWCNAINDIKLWHPMFKQKESELIARIGPKYRMYPSSFANFTLLQRWACLRETILNDALPALFCGYATVLKSSTHNNSTYINIREGRFVNGELRDGVEYDLEDEIKEGSFRANGTIKTGKFEIWEPLEGQWRTFRGEFNPHLGYRDFGTATWDDGSTYCGEFKHCDRQGIGFMKDSAGNITMAGEWHHDKLTIPFAIHDRDGIERDIQTRINDHKEVVACTRYKARRGEFGTQILERPRLLQRREEMELPICGLCGTRGHMRTGCGIHGFWNNPRKK